MSPLNFGTLIYGDTYKIYRSAELGNLGLKELKDTLDKECKEFPKTIIYMNAEGYAFPLYYAFEEWKSRDEYGYRYIHPFGEERSYVNGENPYEFQDVIDREIYFGLIARKFFKEGDGQPCGGINTVIKLLHIIIEPANNPVLFHCLGGFHRTGMIAMCIRLMQGWDLEKIIEEYRDFNPLFYRSKNVEFLERFKDSEEFKDLRILFHRHPT